VLRPQTFVGAALAVICGFFFLQYYLISGLDQLKIKSRALPPELRSQLRGVESHAARSAVEHPGDLIRIATFNIQVFGEEKSRHNEVMEILARIIRNFDIVAIQEIRTQNENFLPEFVKRINAQGAHYDFAIGPRLGDTSSKEQYAFVFDRESVEINRSQIYTMEDPENWMHREPLVAQFRVRGPHIDDAFTFTLVNVHTDPSPQSLTREINVLDNVYRAVRNDGLDEDDVILLGDFNVDDRHFGELAEIPGMVCVISGVPTNTARTAQYDNIVFNDVPTTEYSGRHGVFDFREEFQLTKEQAARVSDHLPVWAEFSIFEQNAQSRLADDRGAPARRTRRAR